jgi:hypothetical protein
MQAEILVSKILADTLFVGVALGCVDAPVNRPDGGADGACHFIVADQIRAEAEGPDTQAHYMPSGKNRL